MLMHYPPSRSTKSITPRLCQQVGMIVGCVDGSWLGRG
jgi:hypothetical protein